MRRYAAGEGFTLGVRAHGTPQRPHIGTMSGRATELIRRLNELFLRRAPKTAVIWWSTLQVNYHAVHKGWGNIGDSLILTIGDYGGSHLQAMGVAIVDLRTYAISCPSQLEHGTPRYEGYRGSSVASLHRLLQHVTEALIRERRNSASHCQEHPGRRQHPHRYGAEATPAEEPTRATKQQQSAQAHAVEEIAEPRPERPRTNPHIVETHVTETKEALHGILYGHTRNDASEIVRCKAKCRPLRDCMGPTSICLYLCLSQNVCLNVCAIVCVQE